MKQQRAVHIFLVIVLPFLTLLVMLSGAGTRPGLSPQRPRYSVPMGEKDREESGHLLSLEEYWDGRVTYPTGRFEQSWLLAAYVQDQQVPRGVPAGDVIYQRANQSPLSLDPQRFTALGPRPQQSNGYGHVSGRVNAIVIDPVTPNVAYLASVGGGVWKTTDCCSPATTWAIVTDDPLIATTAIDDLTIDPNNHNTVYAATGDLNFGSFSMGSAGILKSTNQGATWTVIGETVFGPPYPEPIGYFPQYQAVGKIRVDPRNSSNLVAGTKTGVYFSYDAGANWTTACIPDPYGTQRQDISGLLLRDTGSSTDVYAVVGTRGFSTTVQVNLAENGANGIYRTTLPAGGCPSSWTLVTTPTNGWPVGTGSGIPFRQPGGNLLGRIDVAMAPSNGNVIYAQVQAISATLPYQMGGQLGVWRTTDGGTSWQQRSDVIALGGCGADYNQNWYDQILAVDPNNADVLFMGTFDIWKSTDGGQSFTDVTCGYAGGTSVHVDQHALAYLPGSSSVLLAGSDGGAYVSLDANANPPAFTQINDTLNTIEFYSGDITDNFANAAAPGINAGAQDNGSSVYVWTGGTPGPAVWQERNGGDGMYARIEPMQGLRWYEESQNGNLVVSTNGPFSSLIGITGGWSADTLSFVFPYEIYKYNCPNSGCQNLIAGSNRVWETTVGGIPVPSSGAWYANSPNLTKQTLGNRSFINQLAYAVSDKTVVIVGTNDGNVQYGFNLGQGVANSATWVNVTGGNAVLPNRPMLDVATDPLNPLIGYAAVGGFNENTPSTPGHVFQVTCSANCATYTWVNKSGNLPNIPIDSIIANPRYPQQVFAGSDWGLYYTNDVTAGSPAWYRFEAGLPHVMIWDMAIDHGFTTLALFTRSRGAYAWPLPDAPILTPTPAPTNTPGPSPTPTQTSTPGPTNTPTLTPSPTTCVPGNTDYGFTTTTGASIVPGTTDIGNHCDDCTTMIALPFPVMFYNNTFASGVSVSSNGRLGFTDMDYNWANTCLPDGAGSVNDVIFAHWDDLLTNSPNSGIYTSVSGSAPNRAFNIEWRTTYYGTSQPAHFEVRLFENSSTFELIYDQVAQSGSGATVGAQKDTGSRFTQFSCNTGAISQGLKVTFALLPCGTPPPSTPTVTGTPPTATPTATATPQQPACAIPTWRLQGLYPSLIGRYGFAQSGNDFYVLSGVSSGAVVNTAGHFNASQGYWLPVANIPTGHEASAAALYNGKIYVAGGFTGRATSDFQIYDIASNSWTVGAALPGPTWGAAAGAYNGRVYVAGGGFPPTATLYIYDIATNSWSVGSSLPSPYFLGGYTQAGQYLYMVGSFSGSPRAGTGDDMGPSLLAGNDKPAAPYANGTATLRLDMAGGGWSTGPIFSPGRADFGLAYTDLAPGGPALFAIGGDISGGGYFDPSPQVDRLDLSNWPSGSWTSTSYTLPSARQANSAGFTSSARTRAEMWSTGGIGPNNGWTSANLYLSFWACRAFAPVCFYNTP
jgi:hypothetical protein